MKDNLHSRLRCLKQEEKETSLKNPLFPLFKHSSVSHWTGALTRSQRLFAREDTLRDCCLCVVTRSRGYRAEEKRKRGKSAESGSSRCESRCDSSSTKEKSRASRDEYCETNCEYYETIDSIANKLKVFLFL